MIYYFFICFYYAYSQIIAVTLNKNSHQQKYQQTANNNTYAFYVDKGSPYYLIEIMIVSQMKGEVAFLYQEGSASTKDQNGDLIYDWMDYNGYMLKKPYQYIVIYTDETTQGQKQFVTVLSTQNINYVLSIKGSTDEPCPNNCNSNGECQQGYCYCNDGWIDEDCSQFATQVGVGQAVSISNPSKAKTYAYYQHNGSGKQLELTISTNTLDDVLVQIIVPNLVYLPTDKYYDASAIINQGNPYHAIILQANTNSNDDESYVPEDLIIAFQQQQQTDIQGDITIQIVESKLQGNKTITIVASVLSIVIALTLLFIIYMCFCRNTAKKTIEFENRKQLRQDQIQDKELILMDQLQVIPPQDPTYFNEQECTICLDTLNNGKEIRRTPCNHVFHTKCIQEWVQSKHSHCPNCREYLKIEQLKQPQGETKKIYIQPNTNYITS